MTELRFSHDWLSAGVDGPAFRHTSAQFAIYLGDNCLTRNEDIWSKTVRDSVLVSTYPLAMWFASSWWRLNWEPLPKPGVRPSLDWRMTHELGAANHGFVWPRILFASDGEVINVWAAAASPHGQSVNYLCGLEGPQVVDIGDFQRSVDNFISAVLNRLTAMGLHDSELAALWKLILEDRADRSTSRIRRLEAQMGFDPEECPAEVITQALKLQDQMGDSAMSELAPIYGRRDDGAALGEIAELGSTEGIRGRPQIAPSDLGPVRTKTVPWQKGVEAARQLRAHIGNADEPIDNATLLGLLGLTEHQVDHWSASSRHPAAVAMPVDHNCLNFVPRKRHRLAKRFEFSRFLGDHLREPEGSAHWLASTDLATSRQKYQRAFAAEFLCPIRSLVEFLGDDFTESAFEEAAFRFGVSEQTVESLLANNGYLAAPFYGLEMPYRLAA